MDLAVLQPLLAVRSASGSYSSPSVAAVFDQSMISAIRFVQVHLFVQGRRTLAAAHSSTDMFVLPILKCFLCDVVEFANGPHLHADR